MLKILMGAAGSGKTSAILDMLKKSADISRRALLIVPEQSSFSYEKKLAEQASDARYISSMSFSRFAELTLRKYGGDGRKKMTEAAAFFMMNVALEEISDSLSTYSGNYLSHGFLSQMIDFADECADAGIGPEGLFRFSEREKDRALRQKIGELALILDAYRAVVGRAYIRENDSLLLASEKLFEFRDDDIKLVCIDGFTGFNAGEYEIIKALLARTETVCIALPGKDGASVFEYSRDTVRRLERLAEEAGIPCEKSFTEKKETVSSLCREFISSIENGFSVGQNMPKDEGIRALKASDPADEAEKTAAEIVRLVREEGLRYRDITVVMRSDERYRTLLPSALSRHSVPYFYDMRAAASSGALLQGLQAAIAMATGERDADYLSLIKSPIMGLDPTEAGETENYCYVWSLTKKDWAHEFVNNPAGMTERWNDSDKESLKNIEKCRQKAFYSIERLKSAVKSQSGKAFARGVYDFLCSIGAAENLLRFADTLPESERREFSQQQSLLWDEVMKILELFDSIGEDITLSPKRMYELFSLSLATLKVATPPRTLDEVTVGTADRMIIENAKAVFILGAVQGEFPATPKADGILTNDDRRALIESGLSLLRDSDRLFEYERLLAYTAAAAAERTLTVSYPEKEMTGEALLPSEMFLLAEMCAKERQTEPFLLVTSPQTAVLRYALSEKNTPEASALRKICVEFGLDDEVRRIDLSYEERVHKLTEPDLTQRLFGKKLRLSPSRVEEYYRCPYSYFVDGGLKIRPLQKAELSPAQAGTLIHRVLEKIVSKYGGAALKDADESELRADIRKETYAYLNDVIGDIDKAPKRLVAGFERIGNWLYELLRRLGEEFSCSSFEPVAFELPVGGDEVTAMRLKTVDGNEIEVYGTVDRVDTAEINGRRYVRVVDYKSGSKRFDLRDVYCGVNMQMLIYLFSIWKNGRGELSNALPAGILYMPALGKYHLVPRADDLKLQKEKTAQYRMNGLILDDDDVLEAMEHGGGGIFIPVAKGRTKSEALASFEEMGRLCRLVEDRLVKMAESLYSGKVEARPLRGSGDILPCDRCDYSGICGFERGKAVREIAKLDREQILGEEGSTDGI